MRRPSPAKAAKPPRPRRRVCPMHPHYPLIADADGNLLCSRCQEEAAELAEDRAKNIWKTQGAALGDELIIPTMDGSPAPRFLLQPLRRGSRRRRKPL